jgi:hypothetical protein
MGIRVKRGGLVLPSVRFIITGTSDVQVAFRNRFYLTKTLDEYRHKYPRALWVTGASVGIDHQAALYLHSYGENVYTVVPADKDHIDKLYRQHCSVYEVMPKSCGNTKSERYMARNQRMVDIATMVVEGVYEYVVGKDSIENAVEVFCLAFPDEPEQNRSGTWATVRRARRAGVDEKHIKVRLMV